MTYEYLGYHYEVSVGEYLITAQALMEDTCYTGYSVVSRHDDLETAIKTAVVHCALQAYQHLIEIYINKINELLEDDDSLELEEDLDVLRNRVAKKEAFINKVYKFQDALEIVTRDVKYYLK